MVPLESKILVIDTASPNGQNVSNLNKVLGLGEPES